MYFAFSDVCDYCSDGGRITPYVKYRKTRIKVQDNRRTGKCFFGHRANKTDLHHFRYAYTTSYVKAHPERVFDNTGECCYPHHIMANTVRKFGEMKPKALQVIVKHLDEVSAQRLRTQMELVLAFMDRRGIGERQVTLNGES